MSIAHTLSWEIVSLNDHGNVDQVQQAALEICYGVSLATHTEQEFRQVMESIMGQVTGEVLTRHLRYYTKRGLKGERGEIAHG